MPRPRPAGSGVPHPISSAARRTVCSQSPSAGVSPGMNASPWRARFRSRSSSGSMPSARAASSRFDSTAQMTCGIAEAAERRRRRRVRQDAPGHDPRRRHAVRPAGRRSCPWSPSGRRCRRTPRAGSWPRCPGRPACRPRGSPVRTRISVEVRRTAWNVSSRVRIRRTGRPARRAMKATSGSSFACCLPPKPPPGSGAKTRTFERGRPRIFARIFCSQFGCWMRAPDGDAVAVGGGHERVRLDGEVGHHRERVGVLDDEIGRAGSGVDVAPAEVVLAKDVRAGQRVVRAEGRVLDERRGRVERGRDA